MPQNPLAATVATNPSNQQTPLKTNSAGELLTAGLPALTILDITTATVVKTGTGRVGTVGVVAVGSTASGIYDCLTTAQINATNQIAAFSTTQLAAIPAVALNFPYTTGLVVSPGTGAGLSVTYE